VSETPVSSHDVSMPKVSIYFTISLK
jgi:hypothetical protein